MLNRNALILVLGLWSTAATAQTENNDLVLTLYTQLESLQREIQTLRGMVEEQSNQIRRMQTENRDRYLDVDRRLSELSGAAATTGAALPPTNGFPGTATFPPTGTTTPQSQPLLNDPLGANAAPPVTLGNSPSAAGAQPPAGVQPTAGAPPVATGAVPQTFAGQGIGAELGELELYNTALNILLDQQPARYEESISMFQGYIQRFPQGRRLANAYYWLGEALILVERYEQARDTFTVLVTSYPDHPKAAGALLKRGEVYQRMGQRDLAEQDWRDISTRYPENDTEIREADTRLRRQ